jgi:hypothetical protein
MTQPRTETIELTRDADFAAEVTFDQPVADFESIRFALREDWARDEPDDSSAVFAVELTPTGVYTAEFEIPKATARGLSRRQYVHDIKVTTLAGKTYPAQRGPVFVGPDVGRGA